MADRDYKLFRQVANFCKKCAGTDYPLSIRRVPLTDTLDGFCQFKGKQFLVRINRNLSQEHSIDVMLHEVAHAMAWDKDTDQHGRNWGISYSKLYRKFSEFIAEVLG